MQNNHKPQQIYTEKVFKIMSSLFLSNLKIQFSDRYNFVRLQRLFGQTDMCRHCQYTDCVQLSIHKGCKEPVQVHPVRQVDAWRDKAGPV